MKVASELLAEVARAGEFDAAQCLNCGVCTAVCPMGIATLPRTLQREVLLGLDDRILARLPEVYSCLLCRMCEDNCPAKVRIAENVRRLRTILNRRQFKLD